MERNMKHEMEIGTYRDLKFPKIRGYRFGVPIIRIIIFGAYIGVPPFGGTTRS